MRLKTAWALCAAMALPGPSFAGECASASGSEEVLEPCRRALAKIGGRLAFAGEWEARGLTPREARENAASLWKEYEALVAEASKIDAVRGELEGLKKPAEILRPLFSSNDRPDVATEVPNKPTRTNPDSPKKPEVEILPFPTEGQRQESSDRAQQGEDELDKQPTPERERSGEVAKDYMRGGNPDGATRVLDRVVETGGADENTYRLRAGARYQQEDWKGAYLDAQRVLSTSPGDEQAAKLAGGARMMMSRLGIKPPTLKPPAPSEREPEDAGGVAGGYATGATLGASGEGRAVIEPVGRLGGQSSQTAEIESRLRMGDRQGALLRLSQLLDHEPQNLWALAKRAYLLNRGPRPDPLAALADADRVLAALPDNPAALRERAYALIQLGRLEEGLAAAERAIALDPRNGLGYLYRAMAKAGLGRKQEALADYKRAAELDPALKSFYDEALGEGAPAKGSVPAAGAGHLRLGVIFGGGILLVWGIWSALRAASNLPSRRKSTTDAPVSPGGGGEPTLAPGTVVGGSYRIDGILGRGGMGVVYDAEDQGLRRRVAVKQLRTPEGSEGDVELFLREARLVAQLQHPRIVQIHALAEEGERVYLVFERVEGRALDAVLAENGPMAPGDVGSIVRDVCSALEHAHDARVIHRDIKPSNLMLGADGTCKVMDFGIAHRASGNAAFTRTGAWGTPPYMAPEQESGVVSRESDLYALACSTYELLAGVRPFSTTLDKVNRRLVPLSKMVPTLPAALDSFMDRALDPDPAHRFHSAADFLAAFEASLALDGAPRRG